MQEIANMTIGSFIGSGAGFLALLALIVEISPIKINPWSVFLDAVGKRINADLSSKVDTLQTEVNAQNEKLAETQRQIDDNERDRIRFEILDFANSCRNERRNTQEEFNHIFELYDKYHVILERRQEANGKIDRDMAYIEVLYHKCLADNDFLA